MAIRRSLAKRYAKALISSARNDAELDAIGREMGELALMIQENADLGATLVSPLVSPQSKIALMKTLSQKAGFGLLITRLIDLLIHAGRTDHIIAINETFQEELDQKRGLVHGELFSTSELRPADFVAVQAVLTKTLGKKVLLAQKKDPSLIGGVLVKVGGIIIDGSLKNRLDSLVGTLK